MTSLFSHDWEKREKAARAMDEIQKKFGRQALRKGFWLEEEAKKDSSKVCLILSSLTMKVLLSSYIIYTFIILSLIHI